MAFAASTNPTLLDILLANADDQVVPMLDETVRDHPELALIPARTISGVSYKTLVRTALPTVGFRDLNEGYPASKGTYELRLVETFTFNPRWECDKAVADRYEDGAAAYIAMEARAILEAAMQHLSSQFYYGRGTASGNPSGAGDTKGFYGLLELSEAQGTAVATNPYLVDAGGTTASTGSSVWMIKTGPIHLQWVVGQNGEVAVGEVTEQRVLDASNNPFTAYVQEMLAYPGLQVNSIHSIGRIGEITEDSGKTLTDAMLAQLWAKFPTAFKPNMILMSRRSQRQLQESRIIASGATVLPDGEPVPFPTQWNGIKFTITDAISDIEEVGVLS